MVKEVETKIQENNIKGQQFIYISKKLPKLFRTGQKVTVRVSGDSIIIMKANE